jgi:acyl-CoA dehydrogenase
VAGREVIGLKLNFSKRYITLAPIATVIGLAFRMFDPDKLMGEKADLGITCALIPRDTPGVSIGRRHFPLNMSRSRTAPSRASRRVRAAGCHHRRLRHGRPGLAHAGGAALGGPLHLAALERHRGAKAAVGHRRLRAHPPPVQLPIGSFEGIEAGDRAHGGAHLHHRCRALGDRRRHRRRRKAFGALGDAQVPRHRDRPHVANDAMDVHGGKGICLGPKNYLARGYQIVPVAITVEGANILTRSLIIFGQGAVRCHPFVLKEMNARAIRIERPACASSTARSWVTSASPSRTPCARWSWRSPWRASRAPAGGPTARYFQHVNALQRLLRLRHGCRHADARRLPEEEGNLSARLGDVLSCHVPGLHGAQASRQPGPQEEDLPMVEWACRNLLYQAQEQLHLLRNFPNRPLAASCATSPTASSISWPGSASAIMYDETTLVLPPGKHTLELLFADYQHLSFDPPLHSKKITITVN